MSMHCRLATSVFILAVMWLLAAQSPGQHGELRQAGQVAPSSPPFAKPAPLASLTPEEAERPWEEWTEQQILAKGWTPYRCASEQDRAPEGRRWLRNDPGPARNGTCITYSFMPDGLVLDNPPDLDGGGVSQFRTVLAPAVGGLLPAMVAVNTAMGTWTAAADIHAVLVADNGVAFDGPGAIGDIRITAHSMAMANLAWTYYPRRTVFRWPEMFISTTDRLGSLREPQRFPHLMTFRRWHCTSWDTPSGWTTWALWRLT